MINMTSGRSFKQMTPSALWNIHHNCGRPVAVTVCVNMPDGKLYQVIPGNVIIVDSNNVQIVFPYPVSGEARVS